MPAPAATIRALLSEVVDYAGLFPPAGHDMAAAVAEYGSHLASPDQWMLGRFVVPADRLDELAAQPELGPAGDHRPWRLSVLLGEHVGRDLEALAAFRIARQGEAVVDAVECRCGAADAVERVTALVPDGLTTYVEIGIEQEPRPLLAAISAAGARAKVRTGGVVPAAFPDAGLLARFLVRCAEMQVPFKATAGLHHPLHATRPLTYDANAPTGPMFGFLNVFMAAALARSGAQEGTVASLLTEGAPEAFAFDDQAARWRDRRVSLEQLGTARSSFAIAFGSCSFREPVDGLRALGLL